MAADEQYKAEELLSRKGIAYFTQEVNERKVNVFFGDKNCVRIVESFGHKSLSKYSEEEDFILGIMLGYDRAQQCERYLKRKDLEDSGCKNKSPFKLAISNFQ
jgi:hypothetical protein